MTTITLGPLARRLVAKWIDTHRVEGEVPLSYAEWESTLALIGLGALASMVGDDEVIDECHWQLLDASRRTGLGIHAAAVMPR